MQKNSKYKTIKNFWFAYGPSYNFHTLNEMDLEGVISIYWYWQRNINLNLMCRHTQAQDQIQLTFSLQREEHNYLCSARKVQKNAFILSLCKIWRLLIEETAPLPFPEATGSSATLIYPLNMTLKWAALSGSFQVTATAEKRSSWFPLLLGLNGNSAGNGWRK